MIMTAAKGRGLWPSQNEFVIQSVAIGPLTGRRESLAHDK